MWLAAPCFFSFALASTPAKAEFTGVTGDIKFEYDRPGVPLITVGPNPLPGAGLISKFVYPSPPGQPQAGPPVNTFANLAITTSFAGNAWFVGFPNNADPLNWAQLVGATPAGVVKLSAKINAEFTTNPAGPAVNTGAAIGYLFRGFLPAGWSTDTSARLELSRRPPPPAAPVPLVILNANSGVLAAAGAFSKFVSSATANFVLNPGDTLVVNTELHYNGNFAARAVGDPAVDGGELVDQNPQPVGNCNVASLCVPTMETPCTDWGGSWSPPPLSGACSNIELPVPLFGGAEVAVLAASLAAGGVRSLRRKRGGAPKTGSK